MYMYSSPISSIETLLGGPDPNTFIAVTTTLISLSLSLSATGKSNSAIDASTTVTDPFVIFSPK